jgi:lipid A disaccharide synthetase
MLKHFLHIYKAIKIVITSIKLKVFKNKSLILIDIEIIFIKAIIKLQAENYPTIYYIIPKVYKIYNKLEIFEIEFQVSNNYYSLKSY